MHKKDQKNTVRPTETVTENTKATPTFAKIVNSETNAHIQ